MAAKASAGDKETAPNCAATSRRWATWSMAKIVCTPLLRAARIASNPTVPQPTTAKTWSVATSAKSVQKSPCSGYRPARSPRRRKSNRRSQAALYRPTARELVRLGSPLNRGCLAPSQKAVPADSDSLNRAGNKNNRRSCSRKGADSIADPDRSHALTNRDHSSNEFVSHHRSHIESDFTPVIDVQIGAA